eukprot:COSAG01_NODE_246_length_20450_cov_195.166822_2_plen_44_part_00
MTLLLYNNVLYINKIAESHTPSTTGHEKSLVSVHCVAAAGWLC